MQIPKGVVRYGGVGRLWRGENLVSEVSYQLELWRESKGSTGTLWTSRGVKITQFDSLELELSDQCRVEIRLLSYWWQKGRFELRAREAVEELLADAPASPFFIFS